MKKLYLAALAVFVFSMSFAAVNAIAGGNELAYFKVQELNPMTTADLATGDLQTVYDASAGRVKKIDALLAVPRSAVDAVANGQTSKAVTVTGITASSRCVATPNEVATNAVYIRAVVPTANTATVTVSGDPGASNLDITVICVN